MHRVRGSWEGILRWTQGCESWRLSRSSVFVHAVTDWGIKTFDEYLVEGLLLLHTSITKRFGDQTFSLLARRHVRLLHKAQDLGFWLHDYLYSRIFPQQEASYLWVGGKVSRPTSSQPAVFFVFLQSWYVHLAQLMQSWSWKMAQSYGCTFVYNICVTDQLDFLQESDNWNLFEGIEGVWVCLRGHVFCHFRNVFGNGSIVFDNVPDKRHVRKSTAFLYQWFTRWISSSLLSS